jgi:hypothetical protein
MSDPPIPVLVPHPYTGSKEERAMIPYGKYLVVRKDGKKHFETFNGTGWAYNDNSIIAFYLPKIS